MLRILLVSPGQDSLAALEKALKKRPGIAVVRTSSGESALLFLRSGRAALVVIDEDLGDMSGLDLIKKLLPVDASISCAAVSTLPPDEFVDATEGLGVLTRLPRDPGEAEAEQLLGSFERISGLREGNAATGG